MPPSFQIALPWIVAPLSQDDLEEFAGDSITFTCNVTGIPTPTVTWYFNGARLSGGGASGNSLTISPTTVSHTGMYQCFASNLVGSVQHSWALEVRAPSEGMSQCRHAHTHTHSHTHTHTHTYAHTAFVFPDSLALSKTCSVNVILCQSNSGQNHREATVGGTHC